MMQNDILNRIYNTYKEAIKKSSSMWKSEYCCSVAESKQRDIEDIEYLKYFESLLQKIDNNWRANDTE